MAKANIYGRVNPAPPMGHDAAAHMWRRKIQKQRPRESTTPKQVAAQIVKEARKGDV